MPLPIIGLALGAVELITSLFAPVAKAADDVADAIEKELGDEEIKRRYDVLQQEQANMAQKLTTEKANLSTVTESINEKIARLRAKYGPAPSSGGM